MIQEIKKILIPIDEPNLNIFENTVLSEKFYNFSNNIYSYSLSEDMRFETVSANLGKLVFLNCDIKSEISTNNPYIKLAKGDYRDFNIQSDIEHRQHYRDKNLILKIDLKGHEYNLLHFFERSYFHFSQVVINFYDLTNSYTENGYLNILNEKDRWENKINIFNIFKKFYHIINISPNNNFPTVVDGLPDVLKISFLRNDLCFNLHDKLQPEYPTRAIDKPENDNYPDININWWLEKD
jgi:hypothetical protein